MFGIREAELLSFHLMFWNMLRMLCFALHSVSACHHTSRPKPRVLYLLLIKFSQFIRFLLDFSEHIWIFFHFFSLFFNFIWIYPVFSEFMEYFWNFLHFLGLYEFHSGGFSIFGRRMTILGNVWKSFPYYILPN